MPHQWSCQAPHILSGVTPLPLHRLYTWMGAHVRAPSLPRTEYYLPNICLGLIVHSLCLLLKIRTKIQCFFFSHKYFQGKINGKGWEKRARPHS